MHDLSTAAGAAAAAAAAAAYRSNRLKATMSCVQQGKHVTPPPESRHLVRAPERNA